MSNINAFLMGMVLTSIPFTVHLVIMLRRVRSRIKQAESYIETLQEALDNPAPEDPDMPVMDECVVCGCHEDIDEIDPVNLTCKKCGGE